MVIEDDDGNSSNHEDDRQRAHSDLVAAGLKATERAEAAERLIAKLRERLIAAKRNIGEGRTWFSESTGNSIRRCYDEVAVKIDSMLAALDAAIGKQ